jgi:GT2 family glycosyltransferase
MIHQGAPGKLTTMSDNWAGGPSTETASVDRSGSWSGDEVVRLRREVRRLRAELDWSYRTRDVLGRRLRAALAGRPWRWWARPCFALARATGHLRVRLWNLAPLRDVAPTDGSPCGEPLERRTLRAGTHWCGEGMPQLLVPLALPVSGWVRVRATVDAAVASRAVLYLDTGYGFHEGERLDLGPVAGRTVIDRTVAIRRPTYVVRFDPIQALARCQVTDFDFLPMSAVAFNGWAVGRSVRLWLRGRAQGGGPSLRRGARLLARGRARAFQQRLLDRVQGAPIVADYDRWRARHALTGADRERMRATLAGWADPPLISVILPVYDVDEAYLRACLESVRGQIYPHWQLCVADDASPRPHVRRVCAEHAAADARITVVHRPTNGNVSAASNTALDLARGTHVAMLDHDDVLAEQALFAVARAIVENRAVDWIYSDEDKVTADGSRHYDPFFKPDWSPEYLRSCMYTCHLAVYRTDLVRRVGGWRSPFDGAQDYDLALRIAATDPVVVHLPDVLYHWRAIPASTATGTDVKPDALPRAGLALADHLAATGRGGRVEPGPSLGFHCVRYALRRRPRVSLVIPTGGRAVRREGRATWYVTECVASIRRRSTYGDLELVVIDNDDLDPAVTATLAGFGVRRVAYTEPFNLARKINRGVAAATGEFVVLLNDDVEVITPDWVEAMLEQAQWPEIGAVGPQLLFPDDRLQHAGVTLLDGNPGHPFYRYPGDHPGHFYSSQVTRNWSAVTGACLMTPRDLYLELGGFTERLPLNYNDVDYCLKVGRRAGRRVVCIPHVRLYHHESVSKPPPDPDELDTFKSLWGSAIMLDPYYNPNLTTHSYDFALG